MFAIIQAAGWPIWFLLIASVIALALIVERILYLRRNRILPPNLLQDVIKVYHNGKINNEVVENLETTSPLGRVLAAGLRNVNAPREVMKESIEEAGRGAAHRAIADAADAGSSHRRSRCAIAGHCRRAGRSCGSRGSGPAGRRSQQSGTQFRGRELRRHG